MGEVSINGGAIRTVIAERSKSCSLKGYQFILNMSHTLLNLDNSQSATFSCSNCLNWWDIREEMILIYKLRQAFLSQTHRIHHCPC